MFPYHQYSQNYFDWQNCPNCEARQCASNGDTCSACGKVLKRSEYQRDQESFYRFGDLNRMVGDLLRPKYQPQITSEEIELKLYQADNPRGYKWIWIKIKNYLSIEWKESNKCFGYSIFQGRDTSTVQGYLDWDNCTPFDPPDHFVDSEKELCLVIEEFLKSELGI